MKKYTLNNILLINSIVLFILFVNCSYNIFVPPGNIVEVESPGGIQEKELIIASGGGLTYPCFYGPIGHGFIKVKYGITEDIQLGLRFNGVYKQANSRITYSPFSPGFHISTKFNPSITRRWFGLSNGFGIGFSDIGNYFNFDIGIIIGFENIYIVPFTHLQMYIGIPINPKPYDLSTANDSLGEHIDTASTTFGSRLCVGIKVPFSESNHLKRYCAFYLLAYISEIEDEDFYMTFYTFGAGIELGILRKREYRNNQ